MIANGLHNLDWTVTLTDTQIHAINIHERWRAFGQGRHAAHFNFTPMPYAMKRELALVRRAYYNKLKNETLNPPTTRCPL